MVINTKTKMNHNGIFNIISKISNTFLPIIEKFNFSLTKCSCRLQPNERMTCYENTPQTNPLCFKIDMSKGL